MTPLSLRNRPPRHPTEALDGLVFLPRTIDKARAALAGGDMGDYSLAGLSEMLLQHIGVEPSRFVRVVAAVEDERDVAAWLRQHADTTCYQRWNEWLESRVIDNAIYRARIERRYPVARRNPNLFRLIDVLAADDLVTFGLSAAS